MCQIWRIFDLSNQMRRQLNNHGEKKMATYKHFEILKETEKAINVVITCLNQKRYYWIPKSVSSITDNGLEVIEWFDKKEIEPKLPSAYSFLYSLKHD